MRAFKSLTAIRVNKILDRKGTPVWQRNYYEHIVRDDNGLNTIRTYIVNNPVRVIA